MSPYGTVVTVYRAEVAPPEDVHEAFYFTVEFGVFAQQAVSGAQAFGEASYEEPVTHWAEFATRDAAENFINHWHNAILGWQRELRRTTRSKTAKAPCCQVVCL